ncbi:MAG: fatty acid desaturase [Gammaproteobacteria bacterium]|nr:fatty acid desaturase [Gammaproteobacteria bacterium]MDH4314510.1 fatty acid desaturase [Gammaproteobacteria bacterium]MDH5215399.1 fatty acid desaturase [Gammaproteobacteria bacterium]
MKNIESIPGVLNSVLLCLASAVAAALLWCASHMDSWPAVLAAAVAFSFVNNTLFSLLHEGTHGVLHQNKRINDWMSRFAASFYPTSFSVQRAFHLTHHNRNRTEFEQFDYVRPGDNRFLKYAQWYAILTGLYWIFSPLFCVLYSLAPSGFRSRWLSSRESTVGHQTGAAVYLSSLRQVPVNVIRAETATSAALQASLFLLLDLSVSGWALCYGCFAVNWSALQYADHAWSPLDRRNGAWNLKVNPLTKLLFLNYHDHLAHHRHPGISWLYLPRLVDSTEPRPSFLSIYLRMWLGPRPISDAASDSIADRA